MEYALLIQSLHLLSNSGFPVSCVCCPVGSNSGWILSISKAEERLIITNLSVTSTLTKSSDPYPPSSIEQSEPLKEAAEAAVPVHANCIENGDERSVEAKDEIMADAEETTAEDMTIDVEPLVEVALSSEVPEQTSDSTDS
ncbi:hypothetical protein Droror1_Dr00018115 [Drosera rotundifolia]